MSATAAFPQVQISLPTLVRNAIGEYTSRSVEADPLDASALHLVRQQDGAYAASESEDSFMVSGLAAARSSFAVQSALQGLALGG